jgi:hypothetical protein
MAIRIACDLDGTLADMESALQREAERLFGPDVDLRAGSSLPLAVLQSPARFEDEARARGTGSAEVTPLPGSSKRGLTSREQRALWARVGQIENFWRSLAEIEPGAVARLGELANLHRWEVIFLTQRPGSAGATAQRQSQLWLHANGFNYPSVFVMNGSRGKVADALTLDAVIDDRADNCLDVVADSTARALLVWRDDPSTVPPGAKQLGVTITFSFAEALMHLEKMMAEKQRPEGLLGRIRKAIGV